MVEQQVAMIVTSEKLDAIEKVLYLYLALNAAEMREMPTYEQLMQVSGVRSRTTLSKYLKQLQAKKLLVVENGYLANGFRARNRYVVADCAHLCIDEVLVEQVVSQLLVVVEASGVVLSREQVHELVLIMYPTYANTTAQQLIPLITKVKGDEVAFTTLSAQVHALVSDPLMWQFHQTFPKASYQDQQTLKRLCDHYPREVVRFMLQSVCGKANQANWAYVTATVKTLAQTCTTYEECVVSKKQFFREKKQLQAQKHAEERRKVSLITRLIKLGVFGEVAHPSGYAKKVVMDKQYAECSIYELFEVFTGEDHLQAASYDQEVFDLLYPVAQVG
ncbi:MAG: hypothetical protein ACRC3J_04960 [Culicoidibacterales bacterium]